MGEFLLESILVDAGVRYSDARRICKLIDRERIGGLGSDRIAHLLHLLDVRRMAERKLSEYYTQYGYPEFQRRREPTLFDQACPFD